MDNYTLELKRILDAMDLNREKYESLSRDDRLAKDGKRLNEEFERLQSEGRDLNYKFGKGKFQYVRKFHQWGSKSKSAFSEDDLKLHQIKEKMTSNINTRLKMANVVGEEGLKKLEAAYKKLEIECQKLEAKKNFIPERKLQIEDHKHHRGVFTFKDVFVRGIKDAIVTRVLYPKKPKAEYERCYEHEGVTYRIWDPSLSMLGAAVFGGLPDICIGPGSVVLYVEPSATTLRHISDIVGQNGMVYVASKDLAVKAITKELGNAQHLHDDACNVRRENVNREVHVVISELACRNQVPILSHICATILERGRQFVALINSNLPISRDEESLYAEQMKELRRVSLNTSYLHTLEPYYPGCAFIVGNRV